MNTRLLRLAYTFEFLLGLMAIFTAWSEIGGQATLDMMHWAWKLGFSVTLAGALVAYTASIVSNESLWTFSSVRWLTAIVIILAGMAVVTYFYAMQADAGQSDETGTTTTSSIRPNDRPEPQCWMKTRFGGAGPWPARAAQARKFRSPRVFNGGASSTGPHKLAFPQTRSDCCRQNQHDGQSLLAT